MILSWLEVLVLGTVDKFYSVRDELVIALEATVHTSHLGQNRDCKGLQGTIVEL